MNKKDLNIKGVDYKRTNTVNLTKILEESYKNINMLLLESSDLVNSNNINKEINMHKIRTKTLTIKELCSKLQLLNKTEKDCDKKQTITNTTNINDLSTLSRVLNKSTARKSTKRSSFVETKTTPLNSANTVKQRLQKVKTAIKSNSKVNKNESSNNSLTINNSTRKNSAMEQSDQPSSRSAKIDQVSARNSHISQQTRNNSNINSFINKPIEKQASRQTFININNINNAISAGTYKNPHSNFLNILSSLKSISEIYKGDSILQNYSTLSSSSPMKRNSSLEREKLQLDKNLKLQKLENDIENIHLETSNLKKRIDEDLTKLTSVNTESLNYSSTQMNIENIINSSNRRMDTYKSNFGTCVNYLKDINDIIITNIHNYNTQNIFNQTNVNYNTNNNVNINLDDNTNNKFNNTTINNNINNTQNIGEINIRGISFNLNVKVNSKDNSKMEYSKDLKRKKKKKQHKKNKNESNSNNNSPYNMSKHKPKVYEHANNKEKPQSNKVFDFESDEYSPNKCLESVIDYGGDVEEDVSINKPQKSLIHVVKKNNESSKILNIFNYDHYMLNQLMQQQLHSLSEGKEYEISESNDFISDGDEDTDPNDDYNDDYENKTQINIKTPIEIKEKLEVNKPELQKHFSQGNFNTIK